MDELKHFLEVEIEITSERLAEKLNPIYDGVYVGQAAAEVLRENHIRFCKHLLSLLDK